MSGIPTTTSRRSRPPTSSAPDLKSVTYHLAEGVNWSDGVPFTANDVVFTFEYAKAHRDYPVGFDIYDAEQDTGSIVDVVALDDHTVKFNLQQAGLAGAAQYRPGHAAARAHLEGCRRPGQLRQPQGRGDRPVHRGARLLAQLVQAVQEPGLSRMPTRSRSTASNIRSCRTICRSSPPSPMATSTGRPTASPIPISPTPRNRPTTTIGCRPMPAPICSSTPPRRRSTISNSARRCRWRSTAKRWSILQRSA